MIKLTDRQAEVLKFIKNYIDTKKYPPSCKDISENFGFNRKTALDYLEVLEKKNYIRREKKIARGTEVL